ncbi:stage II sporulation protein M [Methanoregula sp.]|uniref:stage II sporulation protein M n=1 Tax=Methanoregula sp. TaxID=2052170 RepID=UPI002C023303|nr:stage II sporulation protein M [Methanoregula sp.]HVP97158.1 stage II sporulation protein M [Methanoregula sp.]
MSEPGVLPLPELSPLGTVALVTVLLFITSMIAGWMGTVHNPAIGNELLSLFQKEIAGQITLENPVDMCLKIFANNLEACILLFLGGATFGILTLLILSLNGIVIGAVSEIISKGHSVLFIAAAIVPHGIFEIPAFIIAAALGFCMAQALIAEWYGTADTATEAQRLARAFLLYVLPLIAVAAVVEAFITPAIIQIVA